MATTEIWEVNEGEMFFFIDEMFEEGGPTIWEMWTDHNDHENDEHEFHTPGHPEFEHHKPGFGSSRVVVRVKFATE